MVRFRITMRHPPLGWFTNNEAMYIRRTKPSGDSDGEPLSSRIEFYFKDGFMHTWSINYGPCEDYAMEISFFLKRFELETNPDTPRPSYGVPLSTGAQEVPSAAPTSVRDAPSQPKQPQAQPSTSVWDDL